MTGEDNHYMATALYDFRTDVPRELPFTVGQNIIIAPKGVLIFIWIPINFILFKNFNPESEDGCWRPSTARKWV